MEFIMNKLTITASETLHESIQNKRDLTVDSGQRLKRISNYQLSIVNCPLSIKFVRPLKRQIIYG